jgi:hypothetical protein
MHRRIAIGMPAMTFLHFCVAVPQSFALVVGRLLGELGAVTNARQMMTLLEETPVLLSRPKAVQRPAVHRARHAP